MSNVPPESVFTPFVWFFSILDTAFRALAMLSTAVPVLVTGTYIYIVSEIVIEPVLSEVGSLSDAVSVNDHAVRTIG